MARGQAFALEGVVASILILSSLLFALQVTAVTPLSASTSSQHVENQQQSMAEGALASAAKQGELKRALLYWSTADSNGDGEVDGFHNSGSDVQYYRSGTATNPFGEILQRAFSSRSVIFNVYAEYQVDTDGDGAPEKTERQRIIYKGEPSDNAASASRSVVLYDSDELLDASGAPTGTTIGSLASDEFYSDDFNDAAATDNTVFNVVAVEVTVWRQ